MAAVLRLLLVLCLVATAVPAPMAHAATGAHAAAAADGGATQHDDLPPCHGGGAASTDTAPAPPAPDCCADGGECNGGTCNGACGCVHASALPMALVATPADAVPQGPDAIAIRAGAPPRLPPPVRPPIA